ncbi:MAG TPA: HPF/RaiA family ribosome-associated protein [Candidatus Nanoarchaeia archaeon]|nr:HPF/RaiA family ribosome-associated protein [Candidatus Nanoarchaeia archaeon]
MELQTIDFDLLDESDKRDFSRLFNEYSKKIGRKLKNISSFIVHIKEYNKSGMRKKFSIHVRVIVPTRMIEAEAFDWDFKRALHKVFKKLEEEIERRFRVSNEHKR